LGWWWGNAVRCITLSKHIFRLITFIPKSLMSPKQPSREARGKSARLSWGVKLGLVVGLFAILLTMLGATEYLELLGRDFLFQLRGTRSADGRVVLVVIDQASLDALGRYPWDRSLLAEVVERIHAAGAECLALDLALQEPGELAADERLAAAIGLGKTILPTYLHRSAGQPLDWKTPASPFRRQAFGLGHVSLTPDIDGIFRYLYQLRNYGGVSHHAFSVVATAAFRGERLPAEIGTIFTGTISGEITQSERLLINYRGAAGTFPTLSVLEVLRSTVEELRGRLAGKLVFLGAAAEGLYDSVFTPLSPRSPMPAVEVHANAAATMLADDEPLTSPGWLVLLSQLSLSILFGYLFTRYRPKNTVLLFIGFIVGWFLLGWGLFWLLNLFLPLAPILLAVGLVFVSVSLGRLISVNRTLDRRLLSLGKELAPENQILLGRASLTIEMETALGYTLGLHGMELRNGGQVLQRFGTACEGCDRKPEAPLQVFFDDYDSPTVCFCYRGSPSVNETALLAASARKLRELYQQNEQPLPGPLTSLSREQTQAKLAILARLEEALADNRHTFQRVLDAAAEAVLLTNPFGVIRLANAAAVELFGRTDLSGQSIYSLMPGQNLRSAIVEATSTTHRNTIKLHRRILKMTVASLNDEQGLSGFVFTLADITELARIDRMKTEVMHIMSHDLKRPLATIRGFAELLGDKDVSPIERREYSEYIYGETESLLGLIESFLNVSRIESGRTRGEMLPLNPLEIMNEAVEAVRVAAQQSGKIIVEKAPVAASIILADPNLLHSALVNLLDNAIKYAPSGTEIRASVEERVNSIVFSIADDGPGIEPHEQKRIFEKFYRSESAREVGGTGLGLSFVAQVARIHGAEVRVASNPDEGATFSIHFKKKPAVNGA